MIYRRKTYIIEPSFIEEFNALFNDILLPSQLKYGARLIGRWMINKDEENTEVFALWEYDNFQAYEEIENKIKQDEEHVKRVQNRFDEIGRERLKKSIEGRYKTRIHKEYGTARENNIKIHVTVKRKGDENDLEPSSENIL